MLDHYSISRVLGTQFADYHRRPFGGFSSVASKGQMISSRPKAIRRLAKSNERDELIVNAFADAWDGYSVDRVLAEPKRASRFIKACRAAGLTQEPASSLKRRLLRIRKATDLRIKVPSAEKPDKHDHSELIIAAEIASVQIDYRFGASTDDMLCEDHIGEEFDRIAGAVQPGHKPVSYRLAALYLRKNVRSRSSSERTTVTNIAIDELESRWVDVGSLGSLNDESIESQESIVSLFEPERSRYIYLSDVEDTQQTLKSFRSDSFLAVVGNRFWRPSPFGLNVQLIPKSTINGFSLRVLGLRGIESYKPIFNMQLKG